MRVWRKGAQFSGQNLAAQSQNREDLTWGCGTHDPRQLLPRPCAALCPRALRPFRCRQARLLSRRDPNKLIIKLTNIEGDQAFFGYRKDVADTQAFSTPTGSCHCVLKTPFCGCVCVYKSHNLHLNLCLHRHLHWPSATHRKLNHHFRNRHHRTPQHQPPTSPFQPLAPNHLHHHPSHQPHQLLHLQNLQQTSQIAPLHQHRHHRPHTHLTAVAATTTKAGASLIITAVAAIAITAGIGITAIPNTTAPPGDAARPQPPPTLTAPYPPAAAPDNPSTYDPTTTTLAPTPLNIPPQQSSVAHSTAGDLHPIFKLSHQQTNSLTGSNFTPTNSTPPTDHSTNTSPISFPTATSLTRTSPTFDNTPMRSGMKPLANMTNSSTTPSHSLTSTPKPPHQSHQRFPVPLPPTGRSRTSTPAIQAQSTTLPTFYAKVVSYPAHSTLPITLAFSLRVSASPTIQPTTKASSLALFTTLGSSTKTPTHSSLRSSPGAPPPNTLPVAKNRPWPSSTSTTAPSSTRRADAGSFTQTMPLSKDWHGPPTPLHLTYDTTFHHLPTSPPNNYHFHSLSHPTTHTHLRPKRPLLRSRGPFEFSSFQELAVLICRILLWTFHQALPMMFSTCDSSTCHVVSQLVL